MADRSIDKREQYVAFATHCLQLAKVTADHNLALSSEMATEWLRLAEVSNNLRQALPGGFRACSNAFGRRLRLDAAVWGAIKNA